MLALRRRGGGGGSHHEPHYTNGLFAWGRAAVGALGGGYEQDPGSFSYPQPVIVMTGVAKVAVGGNHMLALTDNAEVWTWGTNGKGSQGQGVFPGGDKALLPSVLIPRQIVGGIPIYNKEEFTNKKGKVYECPVGPTGPLLGKVREVACGAFGGNCMALLENGRVASWGTNVSGMLGNGWEEKGLDPQELLELGIWKPQWAPWYVQTSGPPQTNEGGSNLLSGVSLLAAGDEVQFYVRSGVVWWSGSPGGYVGPSESGNAPYAEEDPLWAASGIRNIVEIKGGKYQYMVRLSDHTIRVVGLNGEGCWGTGQAYNPGGGTGGLKDRQIKNPGLSNIIQVAKGEYACFALDSGGKVWSWGSSEEGQLGLGLPLEAEEYASTPQHITTLSNIVEIAAMGGIRGNGEIGGDIVCARDNEGHVWTWGKQFDPGAKLTERGEAIGSLGDETQDDKTAPTKLSLSNITAIAVGSQQMCVSQEPGAPGVGSIKVTSPKSKAVRVEWNPKPQAGAWRGAEGWEVRYRRIEKNPATGKQETEHKSGKLGAGATSWEGTLPAGWAGSTEEIEVIVEEKGETQEFPPTGGTGPRKTLFTGAGKKLTVTWPSPAKPEPGLYVEWRRTELFVRANVTASELTAGLSTGAPITSLHVAAATKAIAANGLLRVTSGAHSQIFTAENAVKIGDTTITVESATPTFAFPSGSEVIEVALEKWNREPILSGTTKELAITLAPTVHHGGTPEVMEGEEVEVLVIGSFELPFNRRKTRAEITP